MATKAMPIATVVVLDPAVVVGASPTYADGEQRGAIAYSPPPRRRRRPFGEPATSKFGWS